MDVTLCVGTRGVGPGSFAAVCYDKLIPDNVHPKIEVARGRTVTIESPQPLPIALDGEQPGTTPVTFTVVPKALRLRVPG